MSQNASNLNYASETWVNLFDKVNEVRYAYSTSIVTANSTLGNTSGNGHVSGIFVANTLVAASNIAGGSISVNTSSLPEITFANLNIISNAYFRSNVRIGGTTLTNQANTTHSNNNYFNAPAYFNANVVISSNTVYNANILANSGIILTNNSRIWANGSTGTGTQYLTTNGSSYWWSDATGGLTVIDSTSNTSVSIAAAANSVKTAYDSSVNANNRATTAQAMAANAYANALIQLANGYIKSNTASGPILRVSTATWTNGGQVFISNSTPTANAKGDIWLRIP